MAVFIREKLFVYTQIGIYIYDYKFFSILIIFSFGIDLNCGPHAHKSYENANATQK
jgi:hypothetical protein